tara:strand:+ start:1166 stop:2776 length:1611 start_codon:yes stop_codon:yes gene_type:complete
MSFCFKAGNINLYNTQNNTICAQSTMNKKHNTFVLLILDGWGYREDHQHNAIAQAHTPVMDQLLQHRPHTLLSCSGEDVGLPEGQMGNSEVGHLCIGAGRIIYQSLSRINHAIDHDLFATNQVLLDTIEQVKQRNSTLHLMGLLSDGGIHAHEAHIIAAIRLAHQHGVTQISLHAFLDGRDTPPRSAHQSLQRIEEVFTELNCGAIKSIVGRYYAMDRDHRWQRTEQAYKLIVEHQGLSHFATAKEALDDAYAADESDEFVKARSVGTHAPLAEGDALIFMNFRADRARQLSYALTDTKFNHFQLTHPKLSAFVTLTEYANNIQAPCIFPPESIPKTLGEVLADAGKHQLRISETEKYAHVTFFFNGGVETPFPDEDRKLIPSPKVASYDLQPEMSSTELTEQLITAIESQDYDVIICNYPNGDMVGHTGDFDAAKKACEAVDQCVGRVLNALEATDGHGIITADHGNVEQMQDTQSHQAHTAHTSEPVPCIYVGNAANVVQTKSGILSDIAPTILSLIGVKVPQDMTGRILFEKK